MHPFNPSTHEVESDLGSSRLAWSTEQVLGQQRLHSGLCLKKQTKAT